MALTRRRRRKYVPLTPWGTRSDYIALAIAVLAALVVVGSFLEGYRDVPAGWPPGYVAVQYWLESPLSYGPTSFTYPKPQPISTIASGEATLSIVAEDRSGFRGVPEVILDDRRLNARWSTEPVEDLERVSVVATASVPPGMHEVRFLVVDGMMRRSYCLYTFWVWD